MITYDYIKQYDGQYVLFAEWCPNENAYRIYDNINPSQTIAYDDNLDTPLYYAQVRHYDKFIVGYPDGATMDVIVTRFKFEDRQ